MTTHDSAPASDTPEEWDLRARFHTLRTEEAARAAPFTAPPARPARVGRAPRRLAAAAAVAAAAVLLWTATRQGAEPDRFQLLSAAAWRAPTDFLLETPGRELLRDLPAVGAVSDLRGPAAGAPDDPGERR